MALRFRGRTVALAAAVVAICGAAALVYALTRLGDDEPPYSLAATEACLDDRGIHNERAVPGQNTIMKGARGELAVSLDPPQRVRIGFVANHGAAIRISDELARLTWMSGFSGSESHPIIRVRRNAVAVSFWTSNTEKQAAEAALDVAQACLAAAENRVATLDP